MGTQNSNNNPYIITIIFLILIIVGGGAYFLFFNGNTKEPERKHSLTPETANTTDDKDAETYKKDTPLGELECVKDQKPDADYCKIDSSKIINAQKGVTYTLTDNDSDLQKLAKITIDEKDARNATIRFDEKLVEQYYGEKGLNFNIYLTFGSDIVYYKITSFGQGVGNEYIFFSMKNGAVGMVSVYSMLKDKKYDPYMMQNIRDITTIVSGSRYDEYSGGHTNFAVKSDKTAYDLQTLLPSMITTNME